MKGIMLFEDISTMTALLIILGVVVVATIVAFIASSYTVVPPDEAHVVVSRKKGRKVYCTRQGTEYAGSAYWKVPIIQRRVIIPLENIQLKVDDIPLRDKAMAKFLGDVVTWLNIDNPLLAAERLGKITEGLKSIISDVENVIQAVTRNESMYWTVIDIMTNRKEFSNKVEASVNEELDEWGMRLVELEVIHFDDVEGKTVIKDLEERQSTVIHSETRKLVANQNKEADIVESNALKEKELIKATNEEVYRQKQIEKDESIGKREQEKMMNISELARKANEKQIDADRALVVGQADIEKQATVTKAEGEAQAEIERGKSKASVVKLSGDAEADVIKAKGFADAESTDKRAEALKKFNEAGVTIETLKSITAVEMEKWKNWGQAMAQAKMNIYSGGAEGGTLLGMPISPSSGFNLGAFASVAKERGFDIQKILEAIASGTLPIAEVTKLIEQKEKTKRSER